MPLLVAARSKAPVCGCSVTGNAGSNSSGWHGCLSPVLRCGQVEASATGRSLVQRSPTKCVRVTVIRCNNSPLHPHWVVGRVQSSKDRKKERKKERKKVINQSVFSNDCSPKRLINGASRRAGRHALNLHIIHNVRWFVPLFVKGRSIAMWSPLYV